MSDIACRSDWKYPAPVLSFQAGFTRQAGPGRRFNQPTLSIFSNSINYRGSHLITCPLSACALIPGGPPRPAQAGNSDLPIYNHDSREVGGEVARFFIYLTHYTIVRTCLQISTYQCNVSIFLRLNLSITKVKYLGKHTFWWRSCTIKKRINLT